MLSIVKGPPFVQALWNVVDMKLMAFNQSIEDANWDHDPKHWQIKLAMNEKQRFKFQTSHKMSWDGNASKKTSLMS